MTDLDPSTTTSQALAPGTRLAQYEIVSVLGAGRMGPTYLARASDQDEEVVIKEYLPLNVARRGADGKVVPLEASLERPFAKGDNAFRQQAFVLSRVDHPNVVRTAGLVQHEGSACLVFEYLPGATLEEWALSRPPPSAARLEWVLRALGSGLAAVHAAGGLHLDVRPQNVRFRDADTPVLFDFGGAPRGVTRFARRADTNYEPPEVRPANQGPWSDIYSLAAIAYRLIAGHAPPPAAERAESQAMAAAVDVGAGRYPPALLAAIDRGLVLDRAQRPQSVEEWLAGVPSASAPLSPAAVVSGPMVMELPPPASPAQTLAEPEPPAEPTEYGDDVLAPAALSARSSWSEATPERDSWLDDDSPRAIADDAAKSEPPSAPVRRAAEPGEVTTQSAPAERDFVMPALALMGAVMLAAVVWRVLNPQGPTQADESTVASAGPAATSLESSPAVSEPTVVIGLAPQPVVDERPSAGEVGAQPPPPIETPRPKVVVAPPPPPPPAPIETPQAKVVVAPPHPPAPIESPRPKVVAPPPPPPSPPPIQSPQAKVVVAPPPPAPIESPRPKVVVTPPPAPPAPIQSPRSKVVTAPPPPPPPKAKAKNERIPAPTLTPPPRVPAPDLPKVSPAPRTPAVTPPQPESPPVVVESIAPEPPPEAAAPVEVAPLPPAATLPTLAARWKASSRDGSWKVSGDCTATIARELRLEFESAPAGSASASGTYAHAFGAMRNSSCPYFHYSARAHGRFEVRAIDASHLRITFKNVECEGDCKENRGLFEPMPPDQDVTVGPSATPDELRVQQAGFVHELRPD